VQGAAPVTDPIRTGGRPNRSLLEPLARPSGAFAMVALDQRESLRTMLVAARGGDGARDEDLVAFKVEAARALTPLASAVLLDVDFGLAAVRAAKAIAPGCGVIVAADRLTQRPGGPVETTDVDDRVLDDDGIATMADAYKLLVIWRPGEEGRRAEVVSRFVAACRRRGRAAVVEGIVRDADDRSAADPDTHAALVRDAAVELTSFGPDLYKAEVPTLGSGDDATIRRAAEAITSSIDCPWVVLSNGTPAGRFDTAMLAACGGGASGFLAGRAIWTASLSAPDRAAHLEQVAAPRLARLAVAVDEAVGRSSR
jgi:sulfofructosephosphate aldolase